MNLSSYFYDNDKKIRTYTTKFKECVCNNEAELWENFIKDTISDKESVIGWHRLLIDYIFKSKNPIHLIRLYESGGYKDQNNVQIDKIRRTALTIDGDIKYMFISNYDAAEMCNIVYKNIEPDIDEFTKMLNNKTYRFHYQNQSPIKSKDAYLEYLQNRNLPNDSLIKSIQEEYYIKSGYPPIGTVRGSVLNESDRYLAHIIGVKDTPYLLPSGELIPGSRIGDILARGVVTDWSSGNNPIRYIDTNLTENDILIIKAHFLRFFDPLNYFATPSKSNHLITGTSPNKNIGEYWKVQKYVESMYEAIYGSEVMSEFKKYALVPTDESNKFNKIKKTTNEQIEFTTVEIRKGIKKKSKASSTTVSYRSKSKKSSKRFTIFKLLKKYIVTNNVQSFSELNREFPKMTSLVTEIRDSTRFFKEELKLVNGDLIRISNQIGDIPDFPKYRNYTVLINKLAEKGVLPDE